MTDFIKLINIPLETLDFLEKLKKGNLYLYQPCLKGSTRLGKQLNLGYSTYAVKIFKMTKAWEDLSETQKNKWINKLFNYQSFNSDQFVNYFIDPYLYKQYTKIISSIKLKNYTKMILNSSLNKNYETLDTYFPKVINAENKQAISTLKEINQNLKIIPKLNEELLSNPKLILNRLDWNTPWDAGAQFSSLSVYNNVFNLNLKNELTNFIESKLDNSTGSYFEGKATSSRQVINGAMKVLSGLDWLEHEIHLPEKLIDYCLANEPELEGCDIVDYIYVLYKCTLQTNYRKKEIIKAFEELAKYLLGFYRKEEKGFSYFKNKSQTHYYGLKTSKGLDEADIHGTLLCVWGIVMILEVIEKNEYGYEKIKP
jgi:hypothetical protein